MRTKNHNIDLYKSGFGAVSFVLITASLLSIITALVYKNEKFLSFSDGNEFLANDSQVNNFIEQESSENNTEDKKEVNVLNSSDYIERDILTMEQVEARVNEVIKNYDLNNKNKNTDQINIEKIYDRISRQADRIYESFSDSLNDAVYGEDSQFTGKSIVLSDSASAKYFTVTDSGATSTLGNVSANNAQLSQLTVLGTSTFSGPVSFNGNISFLNSSSSNATSTGIMSIAKTESVIPNWTSKEVWNVLPCKVKSSSPISITFVDINNDGLEDVFTNTCGASATVWGYKNTGTIGSPSWTSMSNWYVGSPFYNGTIHGRVTFADIDGDGLKDVAYGGYDTNNIRLGRNTGSAENPVFTSVSAWNVSLTGYGTFVFPQFIDLNTDGLMDLVVVDNNKNFFVFKNTGTKTSPVFTAEQTWAADLSVVSGVSAPSITFFDIDLDGDNDFIIGFHYNGGAFAYENIGSSTSPSWVRKASWDPPLVQGSASADRMGGIGTFDVDGDGDRDLFISGRNTGGQDYAFENKSNLGNTAMDIALNGSTKFKFNFNRLDVSVPTFINKGTVISSRDNTSSLTVRNYGTGSALEVYSTSTRLFAIGAGGSVSIGSIAPSATLSIQGSTSSPSTNLLSIASSTGVSVMSILPSGYVGLGVSNPSYLLHLSGGAYSNGASWTNASSKALKENFVSINGEEVLEKISKLEISRWNYITDNASTTHIGPFAEEFNNLFGVNGDNNTISTIDPAGVALVGVKTLFNLVKEIKNTILSFGIKVIDGITHIVDLKIDNSLTVEKGIQVKDAKNGEMYCVYVYDGDLKREKGSCNDKYVSDTEASVIKIIDKDGEGNDIGIGNIEVSTTTNDSNVSSTTGSVLIDNVNVTSTSTNDTNVETNVDIITNNNSTVDSGNTENGSSNNIDNGGDVDNASSIKIDTNTATATDAVIDKNIELINVPEDKERVIMETVIGGE